MIKRSLIHFFSEFVGIGHQRPDLKNNKYRLGMASEYNLYLIVFSKTEYQ